jgi:hypothetical protein
MKSALAHIINKTPGSDLARAGGRYFNFEWHQSHDEISNFQMDAQAH